MKCLQYIYTSCKRGQSGDSGFQIWSLSSGVSEQECEELQRLTNYVEPTGLPAQPTPEEITTLFPIAFSFFRLASGRYGIAQSCYVGRDYATNETGNGRFGNYFVHALIMEEGRFPLRPAEYFQSPIFRRRLTPEEAASSEVPPLLPVLDAREIVPGSSLDFETAQVFVQDGRLGSLKAMLEAIMAHATSHRRLVLCDKPENIVLWLAALQWSLPVHLAHHISFTTFTSDPDGTIFLCCATPRVGGRFGFSPIHINHQYFLFDFITPQQSPLTAKSRFLSVIDLAYNFGQENLLPFHRFLEEYSYYKPDAELEAAYDLYRLTKTGEAEHGLEQIERSVQFAERYATTATLLRLAQTLRPLLTSLCDYLDSESAVPMGRFLFKVARESGKTAEAEIAFSFYGEMLHRLVFGMPPAEIASASLAVDFARQMLAVQEDSTALLRWFSSWAMTPDVLQSLIDSLKDAYALQGAVLLDIYSRIVDKAGLSWAEVVAIPTVLELFKTCFKALAPSPLELSKAVLSLTVSTELSAGLLATARTTAFSKDSSNGPFGELVTRILERSDEATALRLRVCLVEIKAWEVLEEEFRTRLSQAKQKQRFFEQYKQDIFMRLPQWCEQFQHTALELYLKALPASDAWEECGRFLKQPERIRDKKLLQTMCHIYEAGILMNETGARQLVKMRWQEMKIARGILTSPNISELMELGAAAEDKMSNLSELVNYLIQLKPAWFQLSDYRLREWLGWIIPSLLVKAKELKDFENVFLALKEHTLLLIEFGLPVMTVSLKESSLESYKYVVRFIVCYLSSPDRGRPNIRDCFLSVMAKLEGRQLNKINNYIMVSDHPQAIAVHWKKLNEEIALRRNTKPKGIMERLFLMGKKIVQKRKP